MGFILRATLVCILLLLGVQAQAAVRTFAVLPFSVSGPASLSYLEQAIPSMLNSRLYAKGQTQPVTDDTGKLKAVTSSKAAQAELKQLGAEYLIWGIINVTGDQANVDVRVASADGKEWKKTSKTPLSALIGALQASADSINSEVFGRGGSSARSAGSGAAATAPLNAAFVVNESQQRQVYLNPQFRYQGADTDRLRSQALPFAAVGMVVADVTGDGHNEVVLLDEHKVYVYEWGTERMKQIAEYSLPMTLDALLMRNMDIDRDGSDEIIISMLDPDQTMPQSFILSFKNKEARLIAKDIPYFLNVVKLPPEFSPTLVGQRGDSAKIFSAQGVYEMIKNNDRLSDGRKVELPLGVNVLNFSWLPEGSQAEGNKLVVLTKEERLAVYSDKGSRLSLSDEKFSGSAVGIANQMNMPGLGKDTLLIPQMYYIPLRMVPVDLEQRGDYTMLVNKPISVAAQFFDRYRFYPEGEIHDMFWDGVGLGLLWKTRRIKGSVVDFTVADIASNGTQALVVCINTHPGSLGFNQRKTVVVAYPLDVSQTDPNTPVLMER